MKFTREEMTKFLSEGRVTVVFTKVDGTERTMNCTTLGSLIPVDQQPAPLPEGATPRKESMETIRCFDTDLNSWRSFRVDSVKTFTPKSA